jgi:hypothetical protein
MATPLPVLVVLPSFRPCSYNVIVHRHLHERAAILIVFGVSVQSEHLQWLEFRLSGGLELLLSGLYVDQWAISYVNTRPIPSAA